MKHFYSFLISVILLFFSSQQLQAKHIIGGGISYKCLGNNVYEFTVKIYRDCAGNGPPLDNPAWFTVFKDTDVAIINHNPLLVVPPGICVEEGTYIFQVTLPPSAGGYTVAYQTCCRNN